ncbi:MAG: 30S ribosomal protein S6, partial [Patescibacteria group bacterium]|nr:30S ribosomal protein S6 [Patescibacteria group bacterium]
MNETDKDKTSIYEIGYLIAGVPEERVTAEADAIRSAVSAAGASIMAEETPKHERLAYTMRKKTMSGSYDKFDSAHFGWLKFEAVSDKVEALKKQIEAMPAVLRMLLISTVRENTYLGKHAPVVSAIGSRRQAFAPADKVQSDPVEAGVPAPAASVEEMDKSID